MSTPELNRRDFLQAGAIAAATTAAGGTTRAADDPKASKPTLLPTRKLGKTGVDLTILNVGTWQSSGLDRLLRTAYAGGVRVVDTAASYGSEPGIAKWLKSDESIRKNIFLVSKSHPKTPADLIPLLDQRLEALGTDHLDLYFLHGIGTGDYGQESLNWPKSPEFAKVIDKIKKSGKAKYVGFSCHDAKKVEYLNAAAEGGFVDAIMVQYNAWLDKDAPLNKALDACHAKGIGLISMKQVAGQFQNDANIKDIHTRLPMLKEKGLTPYQALLHAIWSDERMTTACVSMRNTDQIRDNLDAARRYEPLKLAEIQQLKAAALAAGPTLCASCDGSCAVAGKTDAALSDLTRLLTYHDHHGDRREARAQYAALGDAARNWSGADLAAAQEACPNHLDFSALLPKVVAKLA